MLARGYVRGSLEADTHRVAVGSGNGTNHTGSYYYIPEQVEEGRKQDAGIRKGKQGLGPGVARAAGSGDNLNDHSSGNQKTGEGTEGRRRNLRAAGRREEGRDWR